jgi:hypothetical protein
MQPPSRHAPGCLSGHFAARHSAIDAVRMRGFDPTTRDESRADGCLGLESARWDEAALRDALGVTARVTRG